MTCPQALQWEASLSWYFKPHCLQTTSFFAEIPIHSLTICPTCQGIKIIPEKIINTVTHRPPSDTGVISPKPTVVKETTEK